MELSSNLIMCAFSNLFCHNATNMNVGGGVASTIKISHTLKITLSNMNKKSSVFANNYGVTLKSDNSGSFWGSIFQDQITNNCNIIITAIQLSQTVEQISAMLNSMLTQFVITNEQIDLIQKKLLELSTNYHSQNKFATLKRLVDFKNSLLYAIKVVCFNLHVACQSQLFDTRPNLTTLTNHYVKFVNLHNMLVDQLK